MRSITGKWFETKVKFEKQTEDGLFKQVTEQYVVEALTFAEAEESIIKAMNALSVNDLDVDDIKKASYREIFFSDDYADKWYKAKLQFITIDENTQKEKRSAVNYLVQAESFDAAKRNIDEVMGGTMIDYEIASVSETNIMDVFCKIRK